MLFNSLEYIFVFLPVALLLYHWVVPGLRAQWQRHLLIVLTLVFYAWGGVQHLVLLLASVALNYTAARLIETVRERAGASRAVLPLAVIANLLLLGYFKYFNFVVGSVVDAMGGTFRAESILLPLGISFFTFQQIAFLVEVARGRVGAGKPLDYAGFVLFFPQLLAGPIVQYKELVPQLGQTLTRQQVARAVMIGMTMFAIGLFKKTVIADTLALYASPVFEAAREGRPIGLLDTWLAAFAYTAQVYFDFSGYSDMAIGSARLFGIILPLNFHSPLRSESVVEVWRRWHITLGRWIQSYVFQPLSIPLARVAAHKGMGRYGTLGLSVIVPTMTAMIIVGVWHGAGWPFVLFGLMQGIYMSVNELWGAYRRKARKGRKGPRAAWKTQLARTATLIAFVVSIIPFGSPHMAETLRMFAAMAGSSGWLVAPDVWPLGAGAALLITALCYVAIFVVPNTQQIMARFEPVLEWSSKWSRSGAGPIVAEWKMTAGWAAFSGAVLFLGVACIMRGTAKFIYFNF